MQYYYKYKTPANFDDMIMVSDGTFLTGLYFENSSDANKHKNLSEEKWLDVFKETKRWLDIYFSGNEPDFYPSYKVNNLTEFRKEVSDILKKIPYGETISYNDIAVRVAKKRGINKMSAQAVGGAARENPICIIIPCHRIIGKNKRKVCYGGGLNNKTELLNLEKMNKKEIN